MACSVTLLIFSLLVTYMEKYILFCSPDFVVLVLVSNIITVNYILIQLIYYDLSSPTTDPYVLIIDHEEEARAFLIFVSVCVFIIWKMVTAISQQGDQLVK